MNKWTARERFRNWWTLSKQCRRRSFKRPKNLPILKHRIFICMNSFKNTKLWRKNRYPYLSKLLRSWRRICHKFEVNWAKMSTKKFNSKKSTRRKSKQWNTSTTKSSRNAERWNWRRRSMRINCSKCRQMWRNKNKDWWGRTKCWKNCTRKMMITAVQLHQEWAKRAATTKHQI